MHRSKYSRILTVHQTNLYLKYRFNIGSADVIISFIQSVPDLTQPSDMTVFVISFAEHVNSATHSSIIVES